jgi:hypothetical protein
MFFHDVNGDGLADLLVTSEDGLHVHLNVGLPTWLDNDHQYVLSAGNPIPEWEVHLPFDPSNTQVGFADMNGNGTDDIVLIGHRFAYVDLLNRTPNLLRQISNGLGATTTITYESSATSVLNDLDDPSTHVPQPMQVVTRVETTNNLPGPNYIDDVVNYEYRNPVYDGRARAFRGFRNVTEKHVGMGANSIAPGSVITRTFAIGACPTGAATPCAEGVDNVAGDSRASQWLNRLGRWDRLPFDGPPDAQCVGCSIRSTGRSCVSCTTQTDTFLYDQWRRRGSTLVPVQNFPIPSSDDHAKLDRRNFVSVHAKSGYARLRSTLHLDNQATPTSP